MTNVNGGSLGLITKGGVRAHQNDTMGWSHIHGKYFSDSARFCNTPFPILPANKKMQNIARTTGTSTTTWGGILRVRKLLNIPFPSCRCAKSIGEFFSIEFEDDLLLYWDYLGLGFCTKRRGRATFWTIYAAISVGLRMLLLVATLWFISGWSRGY